jgi:uncharacterized membrane protein YeaQ/YmgE (transglycosylase-associated protein family)
LEVGVFDFWTVLYLLIVGLVAGYLARVLLTRTGGMSFWMTLLVGVIGSFVGGALGYLLFGWDSDEGWLQPGGIIGSIIGAVLVLWAYRAYLEKQGRPMRRDL